VVSVCAGSLRLSQAKTLGILVAAAMRVQRVSLANIGRMMEGRASAAEQQHYARRLIAAGDRLHRRAEETGGAVIDGDVVAAERPALPCASSSDGDTSSEPDWAP